MDLLDKFSAEVNIVSSVMSPRRFLDLQGLLVADAMLEPSAQERFRLTKVSLFSENNDTGVLRFFNQRLEALVHGR